MAEKLLQTPEITKKNKFVGKKFPKQGQKQGKVVFSAICVCEPCLRILLRYDMKHQRCLYIVTTLISIRLSHF